MNKLSSTWLGQSLKQSRVTECLETGQHSSSASKGTGRSVESLIGGLDGGSRRTHTLTQLPGGDMKWTKRDRCSPSSCPGQLISGFNRL